MLSSVHLLFFRKETHHVQETFQPDLGSLSGSEWAAVEAFPGREIPLAPDTEKPTATKGDAPLFS
tara:strand:- start:3063 stop:3257 length:195 start_codon:yes stop_codon:yes gene_type:complete